MKTHHRKTNYVCVEYHNLDRNYTYMEDGSSMGLSITMPMRTLRHANTQHMCIWDIRYWVHDIYNAHYRTYNTWYLYAPKCTHLLRTWCLALTLYSNSISLCICVYILICAPSSNIIWYNVRLHHILYLLWLCLLMHM